MWESKVSRLRCDTCGKFFKPGSGTSWMFVPDSDITFEEEAIQCQKCTVKSGPPLPAQSVNISVCCGINS